MAQTADRGMSSFDVARMRVDLSEMIGSRPRRRINRIMNKS